MSNENTQPPSDTAEQPKVEEPRKDLNPGGYPCNDCGLTFRTPEEHDEHKSKNSGKAGSEHVQ